MIFREKIILTIKVFQKIWNKDLAFKKTNMLNQKILIFAREVQLYLSRIILQKEEHRHKIKAFLEDFLIVFDLIITQII